MTPIRPVGIEGFAPPSVARVRPTEGGDFAATLTDAISAARASEQTSSGMATEFAAGNPDVGIHEVMIASEEANISLRYATTLKNKVLEAYRELMSTQV